MKSRHPGMITGFCRQCHSDVQLANRIYFCQCGSASDESYDYPPSWLFNLTTRPVVYPLAKAASAQQIAHH